MSSRIIPFRGPPEWTCFECARPFEWEERIFAHVMPVPIHPYEKIVGSGRFTHRAQAQNHLFHLECIKKKVGMLLPKCPFCWQHVDLGKIFDWQSRAIVVLRWARQGAKIGGIAGMILHGSLQGIVNGVMRGGSIGAVWATEVLAIHCIFGRLFKL